MAAGAVSPTDHQGTPPVVPVPMMMADAIAKDAILAWFRGEFAAANAIIDALCSHLAQLDAGSEYEAVFAAIHGRRLNWIPVLQMQKYHSIADVALELKRVAEIKLEAPPVGNMKITDEFSDEKVKVSVENGHLAQEEEEEEEDSPDSDITDSGSQEVQPASESNDGICANHEDCSARPSQIKLTKGFTAKEHVKGHTVNVVKGLKLYETVFTDSELSKLSDFINELRVAGQNGELSGETFILFNKQVKGNKRELIQLGVPIFGHVKEEAASNNNPSSNIEPIPALLQDVIDHLVQWQLIPEYKKPNGCIIHFFDEEEYSQPFLKPPHLDQPISTLILSESTMAYGRILGSDSDGNYRGSLSLSLKKGSLLVMRGNSADMAGHAMCPSSNKRVSITFFRVRPESKQGQSPPTSPMNGAMTLWQPSIPSPYPVPNGALNGYEPTDSMPNWGALHSPVVMLAPMRHMVLSPKRMPNGGTGVFLPWAVGSRKPAKHLPPRAQRGRLLALSSPAETLAAGSASDTGIGIEGKSA
ncbi:HYDROXYPROLINE-RICH GLYCOPROTEIN FAMILY PROTEIN-RELATED [Salix koriyanagi]|uniref:HYDROXYPROLINE-RICH GLYCOPROTEIN FAMILY PROTEIN-RELATED n=1 Tax=Salix koriyanagi TaxID=2511006 RepID=A0A9Q0Z6X0_9ROSI|nr:HYDROXYPROLINE-RICH GLYCOPROTEIN FAMILY PROTEIN-RELATED [Salix koriyanagi]